VPRRVRDDELSFRRRKVAIGHVNRDALLAFRTESVRQQREVHVLISAALRRFLHREKLVFKDAFRIVEQSADEGALAIVHAAGGGETQQG
jgi:hypothetical protein